MENFKINSLNICENPEVFAAFENTKEIIRLLIAEHNSKWAIGFEYTNKAMLSGYTMYPAFNNESNVFYEKRKAKIEIINRILKMDNLDRRMSKELKDLRNTVVFEQLEIFAIPQ